MSGSVFKTLRCTIILRSDTEQMAAPASTHHFTEGLGVLGELAGVLLLHLPHQPLHLLPLDLLLPLLEGRLALDHLVQQAAQRPPVGAKGVALVFHHLRSCRRDGGDSDTRDPVPPICFLFLLVRGYLHM